VLYKTKKVRNFLKKKAEANWEQEYVELVSNKTMAIVGYGDIGYHCAKVAKMGFDMKVIALKRRPEKTSDQDKEVCDEIVGMDQLDRVLGESDFVIDILPSTPETQGFFNM